MKANVAATSLPVDRIAWVDVLRGLGIILVVVAHAYVDPAVRKPIFLFHMPLFFLISGYVFRPSPVSRLVPRRVVGLLVPYVAFLLLVTSLDAAWAAIDGIRPSPRPLWMSAAMLIFGGSALKGVLGVAWFLPCLFFANIAYAFLIQRFGRPTSPALIAVVAAAYVLSCVLPVWPTPLGLGQVPLALVFFWFGALFRAVDLPKWTWLAGLAVYAIGGLWAPMLDMKYMMFGVPGLNLAVALGAALALYHLALWFSRNRLLAACLGGLGRASLVIMFLHMLFVVHMPHSSRWILIACALAVSYLAYWLFGMHRWTRLAFLGQGRTRAVVNTHH